MLRLCRANLIVLAAVGLWLMLHPTRALAQACSGIPAADGEFSLAGSAFFTNGTGGFGARFASNPDGPLSVQGNYKRYDYDALARDGNEWGARLVYEMPDLPFAVCPSIGFQYFRINLPVEGIETDVQFNIVAVPIGFGLARTFPLGGRDAFSVTPYVMPGYLYQRARYQTEGSIVFGEPGTSNDFAGTGGLLIAYRRIFAGGHAFMTTLEGTDPVFHVSAGVIF